MGTRVYTSSEELQQALIRYGADIDDKLAAAAVAFSKATCAEVTLRTIGWSCAQFDGDRLRVDLGELVVSEDDAIFQSNAAFMVPALADAIKSLPAFIRLELIANLLNDEIERLPAIDSENDLASS